MKKVIAPAKKLIGEIVMPGDKSISHRALMLAALAEGKSEIHHLSDCQDVKSTVNCLRELGVEIRQEDNRTIVEGVGLDGLQAPAKTLDAGNSGTTMRLMAGILAGQKFGSRISGDASLRKRPMKRIINPLRDMGAKIEADDDNFAPLSIEKSRLTGIEHRLPLASAQVKSCLLLAGMFARGETVVEEPAFSRDHTERMLKHMGADISVNERRVAIRSFSKLSGGILTIPGDISSASFFLAAAALLPGSEIRIKNVGINPTRIGILEALERMGATVNFENFFVQNNEEISDIIMKSQELNGIKIDGSLIPRIIDEIPIIAVIASQASGETIIRDAKELRVKETDRITAVVENLRKMGAEVTELPDGMIIQGNQHLKTAKIDSYGDHRIAMAFAVAGLVAEGETEIDDAECVDISYPDFFRDLEKIYG